MPFSYALQAKINNLNPGKSHVPKKGLIFKIHLNSGYVWDNWPGYPNAPKNPIGPGYETNYWDQVLFNQSCKSAPAGEDAQDISNKLVGKTIVLDPKFWVGKDIKNYKQQLDTAIVQQKILTQTEFQYLSWGDLTIDQARKYPNCDFTVTKDGQTATTHNVTLDVNSPQQLATFNKINNLIEKDIIQQTEGDILYQGNYIDWDKSDMHIDTNQPNMMQDLIDSVGETPTIEGDCPNFNKLYGKYISFDKINIYRDQVVTMHLKVGSYTKDYQITVNFRSMLPK